MTGYVRIDTINNIADGNVISAADLDGEFNGVQAAFNSSTGHTHDGTASEGAPITKLGPAQDVTISTTVLGVKTTNTVDLGTSSLKFKDFYLAGNALIGGTLGVTSNVTLSGGTINGVPYLNGSRVLTTGSVLNFDGTNLGVGGTSTYKLSVTGSGNNAFSGAIQTINSNAGTGTQTGLWASNGTQSAQFSLAGTGYTAYGAYAAGNVVIYNDQAITLMADNASTGVIKFAAGGNTEGMRLTSTSLYTASGINVFLGNSTDPLGSNRLLVQSASTANNNRTMSVYNTAATSTTAFANRLVQLSSNGSGADVSIHFSDQVANNAYIGMGSGALYFAIGSGTTKNMTLDASSRLLVGLTSSLNANGTIQAGGFSDTRVVIDGSSTQGIYFTKSGADNGTYRVDGSGNFNWFVKGSGTANMTLDASGNLGVNQPSPSFKIDAIGSTTNSSGIVTTLRLKNGGTAANDGAKILFTAGASTDGAGIGSGGQALNSADLRFYTGGSTQAMTLDASGNLLVGTTSSTSVGEKLLVSGYAGVVSDSVAAGIYAGAAGTKDLNFYSNGNSQFFTAARIRVSSDIYTDAGMMAFWTTSNNGANVLTFSEKGRFSSTGDFMVGTTTTSPGSGNTATGNYLGAIGVASFSRAGDASLTINTNTNSKVCRIYRSGSEVGDITVTTTTTSFNSTSDYRLKTVLGAVSDSGSRIDALEPIEYTWNSTGLRTRGFLAHQFQEVYANSVAGTKDAIDAKGNPEYQSMQAGSSEVIADLVAEIQSLRKRLAAANL